MVKAKCPSCGNVVDDLMLHLNTEAINALVAMSDTYDIGQEVEPKSAIGKTRRVLKALGLVKE